MAYIVPAGGRQCFSIMKPKKSKTDNPFGPGGGEKNLLLLELAFERIYEKRGVNKGRKGKLKERAIE